MSVLARLLAVPASIADDRQQAAVCPRTAATLFDARCARHPLAGLVVARP